MRPKEPVRYKFSDETQQSDIFVTKRELFEENPPHWHNFYELEIIMSGTGIHKLNGLEYPLDKGTVLIINPIDFHSILPNERMDILHISFDDNIISEKRLLQFSSNQMQSHIQLDEVAMNQLCLLAELLKEESLREDDGCAKELFESFLCILFRKSKSISGINMSNITGIRKAILYLNLHFRENPSLNQIAAQAGFNPNYFSELFKKTTGFNYSEYLNQLRIGYAKNLLVNGFSVTDACYLSGFGSPSNFLAVFKKSMGLTPMEYKKIQAKL